MNFESNNQKLVSHHCNRSQLPSSPDSGETDSLYYTLPLHSKHFQDSEEMRLLSMFSEVHGVNSARSICPFEWEANVSENRIPRVVMTARCRNDVVYANGPDERQVMCVPVTYVLPVLKLDNCHYGFSVYRQTWESINVSCVPKVLPKALRYGIQSMHQPPSHLVAPSRITTSPRPLLQRTAETFSGIGFD